MIVRFVVDGTSIQGVQFRETLSKIAKKYELKGEVKNLLDGTVEVLFLYKDNSDKIKKCFEEAINKLEEEGLIDKDDKDSIKINENTIGNFIINKNDKYEYKKIETNIKDFTIIRGHELQETVWALQGAGKVFLSASRKNEQMLISLRSTSIKVEELLNFKKQEVVGRLKSVQKELLQTQEDINLVDKLICLEKFITDPLIDFSAGRTKRE